MDDKNKYYTPELEELHIGFEVEKAVYISTGRYPSPRVLDSWEKVTINHPIMMSICSWGASEFRVKYLDQQDIEECGFTFLKKDWGNDIYEKPVYKTGKLTLYLERTYVIILCKDGEYDVTLFRGNIKNKTEFKKVLKMLWV